jgi:hypothetical protein
MAIDFPDSPTTGDTFTAGNRTWEWSGSAWEILKTAIYPIQKTIVDAKGDLVSATADDTPARLGVGADGALLMADSGEATGIKWSQPGYTYVQTVYFTSSGTFTKATYPWLRAVKVGVQGGGGGGAYASATGAGQVSGGGGGGGGAYTESFILASSLAASETVTIGLGGAGGASGNGGTGGTSQFGTLVTAGGGSGGGFAAATSSFPVGTLAGVGGTTGTGDVRFEGSGGSSALLLANAANGCFGGAGGNSYLGGGAAERRYTLDADTGKQYGGGGGGAANIASGTAKSGGNGADGIVIVELYA